MFRIVGALFLLSAMVAHGQQPIPIIFDTDIGSDIDDALALALRVDCPIFVEDEVLKSSKISSAISEKSTIEELRKWLEGLSDEDLGRYKM